MWAERDGFIKLRKLQQIIRLDPADKHMLKM